MPYISSWDVCLRLESGASETWIRNRTDALWVVQGVSWSDVSERVLADDALGAGAAKEAALSVMLVDSVFLSPGASMRIHRPPEDVAWALDLETTLAWEAQGALLDAVNARLGPAYVRSLTSQVGSRALAVCALEVHNYAQSVDDWGATDPYEVIIGGLGAAGTANACYTETKKVPVHFQDGRVSTLGDEVLRPLPQLQVLDDVNAKLGPFKSTVRVVGLKLITRARG
ncbi:hypothetical protein LVO85_15655 [Ornithinimicrobium sp. EGI L100131]|nr:hypothetical protein [Ornithinimicrobium sediminis]